MNTYVRAFVALEGLFFEAAKVEPSAFNLGSRRHVCFIAAITIKSLFTLNKMHCTQKFANTHKKRLFRNYDDFHIFRSKTRYMRDLYLANCPPPQSNWLEKVVFSSNTLKVASLRLRATYVFGRQFVKLERFLKGVQNNYPTFFADCLK